MAIRLITTYSEEEFEAFCIKCFDKLLPREVNPPSQTGLPAKTIFTRQETAELLTISLPTLHDYTMRGLIKAYRLGNRVRYRLVDIENALVQIKTRK